MLNKAIPLIAALAFTCVTQAAEGQGLRLKALEQAIEASGHTMRLPDRTPGSFIARTCDTCPALTLRVTEATRFLFGKTAVTQNEFNQTVQKADPDPTLGIFYDGKTLEVTRVVAFGIASKPVNQPTSRRGK